MYAFLDIAAFVIGVLNQVMRASEADHPIDDNDFAMVTQVDAIPLVTQGIQWECLVHRDSRRAQLLQNWPLKQ